jgi:hypothetical protein
MSCCVSAASQRQISDATKPRRTHHPWKGSRRYRFGSGGYCTDTQGLTGCSIAGATEP